MASSARFQGRTERNWITDCLISLLSSVQFSGSVVSDSLQPHGLQHTRTPCPSPTPRVYSTSRPLSRWCHPTISSSVVPFSSHLQSFPGSESFQMSQFFTSGGPSIGVSASASVLPVNIQDWSPLGWTGWIFSLMLKCSLPPAASLVLTARGGGNLACPLPFFSSPST